MLSRQKRLPDPAAVDLEPIHHDPAYAAALAELEQLEGRLAQVEPAAARSSGPNFLPEAAPFRRSIRARSWRPPMKRKRCYAPVLSRRRRG